MSYLIDTPVVSELVRPRPNAGVIAWIGAVDEAALCLSVLTVGELRKGIEKLAASRRRARLDAWLRDELLPRFGERILPITTDVAALWGELSGKAERKGAPLPVIDALIAATALSRSLIVVTRNVRHFERAGARVLDPWTST